MAIFNPQVQPTPDPYFLHLSRPIGNIDTDKSKALAISTVGEGISDVVKGADEVVKKTIEDKVYDKASAVRDQFSSQLAEADTLVRQRPQLITEDGDTGGGPATGVPAQLKGLPSTLSMLDNARANGKVSPTNYKAQLDSIASDLRSQFPGYRQYIDSQFEKVVGMNPANALIESRIQDINSFQTRINENQNKVLTYLGSHAQYPVTAALAQRAQTGNLSMSQAIAALSPFLQSEHNLKNDTASIENEKLKGELASTKASQAIGDYVTGWGAAHVNGIVIAANGEHPAMPIQDYIEGVLKGSVKFPTPQEMEGLTQMISADKAAAQREMKAELYRKNPDDLRDKRDPNSGRTPASYIKTPEEINNHIKAGTALHDTLLGLINDKDTGTAGALARMSTTLVDARYSALLQSTESADPSNPKSPALGQMLTTLAVGTKAGGQNVGPLVLSKILGMGFGTVWGTVAAKTGADLTTPKDIRSGATYLGGQQPPTSTPTAPGAPPKPQAQLPPPPTMNNAVTKLIENGAPPQVVKVITDLPKIISDPKQPDSKKLALVENTFSKENIPLLNNFVRENRDPDTGKVQGGQYSTFKTYGSIAPDIVKLEKAQPGNNVLANYKNWMENSFSRILFPSELKDLSQFKATTNVDFHYSNMPNEPPKIIPVWPKPDRNYTGPGLDPAVDPTFVKYAKPQIQASVDRLNSGLATMSNVANSIPGMDVNSYIYQLFAANRVAGTVPDQILQAIHSSRPDLVQKYTDTSEEASKGDLGSFINNPGRSVPRTRNNAPAARSVAPGGMNLGEILGVKVDNIPKGMTATEFLRLLKERGQ